MMLKKLNYILVLGVAMGLFSCSEATDESSTADTEEVSTENEGEGEEGDDATDQEESEGAETETTGEDEEISGRYNYDVDFEVFKKAVIAKDIKGVSAFAGSDEIDAEALIQLFEDPDFLADLKKATYDDLTVDDSGDEVLLVFSSSVSGSDDEGNEFESGVYLYFSQGDPSLLLENFMAAG